MNSSTVVTPLSICVALPARTTRSTSDSGVVVRVGVVKRVIIFSVCFAAHVVRSVTNAVLLVLCVGSVKQVAHDIVCGVTVLMSNLQGGRSIKCGSDQPVNQMCRSASVTPQVDRFVPFRSGRLFQDSPHFDVGTSTALRLVRQRPNLTAIGHLIQSFEPGNRLPFHIHNDISKGCVELV